MFVSHSQKNILTLLESGKVPGENKSPLHIETVISNVFVFDDTVYKLYKNDNDFFNKGFRDLSDRDARFNFTKRDFEWNHSLSPSIYLELKGVRVHDDQLQFTKLIDAAEELLIVMNRVDANDVLFEKLMRGEITKDEAFTMGKQLAQTLKQARTVKVEGHNYHQLFADRIKDLREWMQSVTEHISKEESSEYCDFLEAFRNKNRKLFEGRLSNELAHSGDSHSQNAIFSNGTLYLIDTFPPKEEWLIEHQLMPLYRIGADIWGLSGDKGLFDSFVAGYENEGGLKVDHDLDSFFVIYASAIMVSYLYMLQRTDTDKKEAAKRLHEFIRKYYESSMH